MNQARLHRIAEWSYVLFLFFFGLTGLLFLGSSGDALFHKYDELLYTTMGNKPLPELTGWLLRTYAYNEGDFYRSCVCFAWLWSMILIFALSRGPGFTVSTFVHGAVLLLLIFFAYVAFLVFVASMPFYVTIQASQRPYSLTSVVLHWASGVLPIATGLFAVYVWFIRRKPC